MIRWRPTDADVGPARRGSWDGNPVVVDARPTQINHKKGKYWLSSIAFSREVTDGMGWEVGDHVMWRYDDGEIVAWKDKKGRVLSRTGKRMIVRFRMKEDYGRLLKNKVVNSYHIVSDHLRFRLDEEKLTITV
jgi:hypothetical protein